METIGSAWKDVYPIGAIWAEYYEDARNVPGAILDNVEVGGRSVRKLIPFEDDAKQVDELLKAVRVKNPVKAGMPMRALVAAYRLAFDELLRSYDAKAIVAELPRLKRLEDAMRQLLKPDTRGGETLHSAAASTMSETANLWSKWLKR